MLTDCSRKIIRTDNDITNTIRSPFSISSSPLRFKCYFFHLIYIQCLSPLCTFWLLMEIINTALPSAQRVNTDYLTCMHLVSVNKLQVRAPPAMARGVPTSCWCNSCLILLLLLLLLQVALFVREICNIATNIIIMILITR